MRPDAETFSNIYVVPATASQIVRNPDLERINSNQRIKTCNVELSTSLKA
jgi:hypothetical protein